MLFLARSCSSHNSPVLSTPPTDAAQGGGCGPWPAGMMKWHVDASEVVAVTAMGVWEAVLAGGGRRFIKRKDSDAGETGALASPPSFVFVAD